MESEPALDSLVLSHFLRRTGIHFGGKCSNVLRRRRAGEYCHRVSAPRISGHDLMILAITFKPTDAERGIVSEVVSDIAESRYLTDLDESGRQDILSRADVVLARNTGKELRPEELPLVGKARLVQFLSAGL